jgi:hypothetical protein
MLNFDLMDTVAGQQIHEMRLIEGILEMVLEVLEERFGIVPNDMIQQIRTISQRVHLKPLLRQTFRCPDIDSFKQMLSKALSSSKE